eukprot:TRINITY_DN27257_c0_g1_i1.p1 TRINITY_DN27257_c0_g1~~TRINITY_DN27257_c0_g1_i1.p1  ORF type:complete len:129 (+),score=5.56 TRINITY_DN27257_c0_g1_i1:373-759(+)
MRFFGFTASFENLVFQFARQLLSMVIIQVPFRLQVISSFMRGPNTFRQHVLSRLLFLPHVSSHNQLADLFAKALPRPRHDFLVTKLMLSHNPHQFGGKCKDEKPDPVHKSSPGLTFCIMYSLSHSSGP